MLTTLFSKVATTLNSLSEKTEDRLEQVTSSLHEVTLDGDYVLKVCDWWSLVVPDGIAADLQPLDAVLFAGSDPVANFIKKVELHEVVPRIERPFHELWTHAGILVDKSVLPLDCLEEGKLYLYESVFSGRVAGYVYSNVLPVDHPVAPGGFHLGPQIRDFAAVVAEGDADVGICPLTGPQREYLNAELQKNPNLILNLYNEYKEFGYPITNILPVLASASKSLYEDLDYFNKIGSEFFPHPQKKKVVFCSELVSIIYREIGLDSFRKALPNTFTPLAVEVVDEFGSTVYYAKENKQQAQRALHSQSFHKYWVAVGPSGGVPANAEQAGVDLDGAKVYISRVKIGSSYRIGKIIAGEKTPLVGYFGREVRINYGHEVLTAAVGQIEWVDCEEGEIPSHAIEAGIEEDGTPFYVARAVVGEHNGFLGFAHKPGVYVPGGIAKNLGGAHVPFDGKEVKAKKYQVMCHKGLLRGAEIAVAKGLRRPLVDPHSGTVYHHTFDSLPDVDVNHAVRVAKLAFEAEQLHQAWHPTNRRDALLKIADAIDADSEELVRCETSTGKTVSEAQFDVSSSAGLFRFYAGLSDKIHGRMFANTPNAHTFTVRQPLGVCGLITSFNYPLLLASYKLSACLAAGSAAILKPAPQTPLSTLHLASLAAPHVPAGYVQVLLGDADVGRALAEHPDVACLSFTGSTKAGAQVAAAASSSSPPKFASQRDTVGAPRRTVLELGGKNFAIIDRGVSDLSRVIEIVADAALGNAGQNCCAVSNVLVHTDVYDQVVKLLVDRFRSWTRLGDSRIDPTVTVGPVIDAAARDRIYEVLARASATHEVRVEYGGHKVDGTEGFFVQPTILAGVKDDDEISTEEVFGPVLSILKPFSTMHEAVQRVNNGKYGLAAGVFTDSVKNIGYASANLRVGFLWINSYNDVPPYMPLGGVKASGYGKDCGFEAIDAFTTTKSVYSYYG
ncbi:hypothetical protein HDU82_002424 [Entophlyctis luteolus]|nr:hypothetical protein HDU82_002424 [Entophlyctis luteolus]